MTPQSRRSTTSSKWAWTPVLEPARSYVLRYGGAVAAVLAAYWVREELQRLVGGPLPTYVTFYPIVMLAAMLAGLGPGLLATAASAAAAGYWILPPIGQLAIASPADRLGLALFTGVCLFINVVGEMHWRARRKAAEYEREAQFRLIFTDALVGMVQLEPGTGGFLRVNAAFCRFTGYSAAELLQRTIHEITHPDDRALTDEKLNALGRGELTELDIEKRYVRCDGATVWGRVNENLIRGSAEQPPYVFATIQDVTERKRAEEALRESEARLRLALQSGRLAAWEFDPVTRQVTTSDNADQVLALPPSENVENSERGYSLIHPDDVEKHRALVDEAIRKGGSYVSTYRQVRDGEVLWLEERGRAILDASGNTSRLVGVTQNVTARKRVELDLERMRSILLEGERIAHLGSWQWIADTGETLWSEEEFRIYGLEPGAMSPSYHELMTKHVHPEDAATLDRVFGEAIQTRSVFENDHRIIRPDGSVRFIHNRAHPHFDGDGRLLGYVGATLDTTERKEAEEAVRRSETLLRAITDNSPNPVFLKDRECRILLANPATLAALRKSNEEVLGKTDEEFYDDPEVGRRMMANDRLVMETGRTETVEEVVPGPDGPRTFLSTKTPYRDIEGRVIGLIGIAHDITERKQAEAALRESEQREKVAQALTAERQRLYDVLETLPAMICLLTPDYHVAFANRAFRVRFGESHGRHCYEYCFGRNQPCDFCESYNVLKTGEPHRWEVKGEDGSVIDAHDFPFTDVDGSPMILEMDIDITEFRKAQAGLREANERLEERVAERTAELQRSEEQFRTLADSIPNLAWWANGDGYITWYNRRWYEYTGTTPEQMEGWGWQSVHDPEMLPKVLERWKASIATGEPFEMEFPLRGANGKFRIFLTRVHPLKDAQGRVVRWFGTNTDVDELKRTEEALRASERLYRAIGESIDYGIWICDAEGRNIYASDSLLKLVGITADQCKDFGWGDVLHPDDAETTIAAWKECVETGSPWYREHRYRGVDGRWHPILACGVPVRDEQGAITHWAGINLDISQLKHAEAAVRADLAALTRMHDLSGKLLGASGLQPLLQEVMDAAVEIVGAERGTLQLLEGDSLWIVAHHGHQQPFLEFFASADNRASVCGEATKRGERVVVPDVETSALFAGTASLAVLREAGVRAVQSTPMMSRAGELLGILTTHWPRPYQPDEHDLWRIDLLARQAADLIEFTRSEASLRENEQRLKLAQQAAKIGAFEWNVQTGVNVWTPELEAMYGLAPGEFGNTQPAWEQLVHPEDRTKAVEWVNLAFETHEPVEGEWRVVWRDGSVHWLMGRFQVFEDAAGKPLSLSGVNIDITERKQAEVAAEEARAKLAAAFASMNDAIFVADAEGRLTEFNDEFVRYHRFKDRDECSRTIADCPKYLEAFFADGMPAPPEQWAMARALRGEAASNFEYRLHRKDSGETWWGSYSFAPIKDSEARITGAVVAAREVTDLKRADEALRLSEEQFRAYAARLTAVLDVQREIANANVEYDALRQLILECMSRLLEAEGATLEISEGEEMVTEAATGQAARFVGQRLKTAGSLTGLSMTSNQILRTDDSEIDPRVDREAARRAGSRSMIAMPLRFDERSFGVLKLLSHRAAAFTSNAEETLRMMGEFLGVTLARQRAQAALRESHDRLKRVLEVQAVGVMFWDLTTGCLVDANDTFLKLMGYTRSDVESHTLTWQKFTPPEYHEVSLAEIRKFQATGRVGPYEKEYFHKDGTRQWLLFSGSSLGENSCVEFCIDISARKKAEAGLRERDEQFATLIENLHSGVALVDENGSFAIYNCAFLKLFGLSSEVGNINDQDWGRWQVFNEDGTLLHVDDHPVRKAALTCQPVKDRLVRVKRPSDENDVWLLISTEPILKATGQLRLLICTYYDVTERKRAEEFIKASLREKEVMLKEIHHRVKNNLQVIASLVDLQAGGMKEPALLETFADIRDRVRSMALVHEKLYHSESLARVDFADYMQSLLGYLSRSHTKPESRIELKNELQPVLLSVEKAVPCGLIVNELVSNAYKHAFRGRTTGEIRVTLSAGPDGRVHVRIGDNGVGLPAGLDWRQSRSLGLRLVQLLSGQLHAAVEVRNGNGAEFEVVFEPEKAGEEA